jgi:DNA-binding response OmpR family regulator
MRILIAQNNSNISEKIKHNLLAEDYDVDVVSEGETALSFAKQGNYSAIILDILLDKINGFDVCENIRDSNIRTPILMLTDKSTCADEVDSLESGADDFLRIPFSLPVLMARIKVLLRSEDKERSGDIASGLFFYSHKKKKWFFDEQEIFLTSQESKILEILVLAKGNVVPKQTLLNQIWGIDFNGDPNIIYVYIGYLRHKLAVYQDTEVIETIRSIGYRLVNKRE